MLKKFMLILLLPIALFSESAEVDQSKVIKQHSDVVAQSACAAVMLAVAYSFAQGYAAQGLPERLSEQITLKNLLTSFCVNYVDRFITTVGHECGHAFMAKLVNGDPLDINLGGDGRESLISVGPFHLRGFDPGVGYACVTIPYKNNLSSIVREILQQEGVVADKASAQGENVFENVDVEKFIEKIKKHPLRKAAIHKPKRAAVILAGGIAGMATHFLFKTARTYLCDNRVVGHGDSFFSKLKRSMFLALEPDCAYVDQLFNMLVPVDFGGQGGSDGSNLFNDVLDIDPQWTNALSQVSPLGLLIAKIMVVSKWHSSGPSQFVVDIPLVLFNQLTEHLLEVYTA